MVGALWIPRLFFLSFFFFSLLSPFLPFPSLIFFSVFSFFLRLWLPSRAPRGEGPRWGSRGAGGEEREKGPGEGGEGGGRGFLVGPAGGAWGGRWRLHGGPGEGRLGGADGGRGPTWRGPRPIKNTMRSGPVGFFLNSPFPNGPPLR